MVNLVVDITHPPFGHENTFAALYVAAASLSKGYEVLVVMREDGVFSGRAGQQEPLEKINLPPTESQVKDVIELDGRVIADKGSMERRGIAEDELIAGIEVQNSENINELILEHGGHVISF
jgi:sulfur relay (sulfurtransferase) DsrF/TusC family protein